MCRSPRPRPSPSPCPQPPRHQRRPAPRLSIDATKSAYIFNFGKKAGETLATVWATDKGYLRYMIQEKVRCLRACALPARAAAGCARRLVCVALTARVPCGRKSTRSRAWPTFAPRSPPRASSTSTRARSMTPPRCQTRSASCVRTPRSCVCARRRSPMSPSVWTTSLPCWRPGGREPRAAGEKRGGRVSSAGPHARAMGGVSRCVCSGRVKPPDPAVPLSAFIGHSMTATWIFAHASNGSRAPSPLAVARMWCGKQCRTF
mmetsp:Transcript_10453/g.25880  ORF Transcript_10453/g.25880 Transcript_10453/m.25880 type:complete len:261 (+) Transcript_10453:556-1338(+)